MTGEFARCCSRRIVKGCCGSQTLARSCGSTGGWTGWRRWFVPLPEPLQKIGDEILRHFGDRGSTPPYMLYVYEPEAELAVRREMQDLVAYLNAHGIDVAA